MPEFELADPFGTRYKWRTLYGQRGLIIAFTCNHCPYAVAVWPRVIRLAAYAKSLHINTVAINPNIHPDYPQDSPEEMKKKIKEWGITFPYVIDETQDVARRFKAQCTPDLYFFGSDHKLVYHGRLDDNWKDESKVTQEDFKEAINCYITGDPLTEKQMPSMGCSIKWRE